MNLLQLQYVREIADAMSINKAAQKLYMSQSSLSKAVISLEKELGTPLFSRSYSGVTLTPYGKYFVAETRDILDRLNQLSLAAPNFESTNRATLTVASGSMKAAGYFFAQLAAKYEAIQEKDFRYYQCSKSQVVETVSNGVCNIGICILLDANMDNIKKLFKQCKLEYHVLGIFDLGVTLPSNHPLAYHKVLAVEQLQGYPLLTLHEEHRIFQIWDELLLQLFPQSYILESSDVESAMTIGSQTSGFLTSAANNTLYKRAGFSIVPPPIQLLDAPYRYEIGWIKRISTPLSSIEAEYIKLLRDFF